MGGNNNDPQAAMSTNNMTLSDRGSGYSNTMNPSNVRVPTNIQQKDVPDLQTQNMIKNMKAMQDSGVFDTPYQKRMKEHPLLMTLGTGLQAMGQGMTKQPYYTDTQNNQASLQNTQESGLNSIATLPAQMRMQMMMAGMMNNGSQGQQGSIPGVPNQSSMPQVINTPASGFSVGQKYNGHTILGVKKVG